MTSDEGRKPEGAPERSPKAGVGAPSGVDGNGPKRFSVQRKIAIVARLLRGEPLDLVARQTNVSIARLTEWRDRALAGGSSLSSTSSIRFDITGAEQTNLKLRELRPSVDRVTLGLGLVSFLGCLMTLIYMWSVR